MVRLRPGVGHVREPGLCWWELLGRLRAGGVEVIQGPESHENGKFAWIIDPDKNKIELWEPKVWDDKNKAG